MKKIILAFACLCAFTSTSLAQKTIDIYLDGLRKAEKEDFHGAIENYNIVLKRTPNDTACYYARSIAKSKIGDYKGALKDCNKALELNPNNPVYYYRRSFLKSDQRDHKGAIVDLTKAIQLNPNNDEYYFARGMEKAEIKSYQDAVVDYDAAIKLKEYAMYFYMRGMSKYNAGDKSGGCEDMKKSVDLGAERAAETMKQMCD